MRSKTMKNRSEVRLSRRNLLKTGSGLIALTVMPAGMIIGANSAWSADVQALKPESFATLVQVCRDIYPHDRLADVYYAGVVEGFDAAAKGDDEERKALEAEVDSLNQAAQTMNGADYASVPWEIERVEILRSMQDPAFFQKLRGALVGGIYGNPEVWPAFGYEGESASKGGYLHRGFDDIDWLEQV